ncbi:MAG: hypothetical protein JWP25_3597 [Bradyrhizobium sp.]|nr:hypothetical protein [Bradyrhizobium sp.]
MTTVTPDREALLARIELALTQAQSCIKGETPEDITFGEAEDDTFSKIRDALDDMQTLRRLAAKPADEGLALQAVRADERIACWKIAEKERDALKNADPKKAAWLVAFDIANAIKRRDSTPQEPNP